jgi:hypothetical protein
MHKNELKQ